MALALALAGAACAADFGYSVEVEADSSGLNSLLERYLDIVKFRNSELMSPDQLRRLYRDMPAQAADLLATEGYFSPKITPTLNETGQHWQVGLKVQAGEPTLVDTLDLSVDGALNDEPDVERRKRAMERAWPLKPGLQFRQADWVDAKRRALQVLLTDRFPAAAVADSEARIDPANNRAQLRVKYDSGPRFTLGAVNVTGLLRYPRAIIDHLHEIRPGDPYDYAKLSELQSALLATPYFKSVYVEVETDPAAPEQVPVKVTVVEAPLQKISLGVGYGTDKGARTEADYRYNNVLDRGWLFRAKTTIEQRQQTGEVGIDLPRNEKGYYDGAYARINRQEAQGLVTAKKETGATRSRSKGIITTSLGINYLTEDATLGDVHTSNQALTLSYKWVRRDVDNVLDPRRGNVIELQSAGAVRGMLSDTSFVRGYARGVLYYSFGAGRTVQLRGEAGQVVAEDAARVPTDWLFRVGGSGSVRGYAFESLGVQAEGGVQPGKVMATSSVEYQQHVVGNWRAAVFVDAGNAAESWQSFHFARGYGAGARWKSPVGPFALDLAYGEDARKWRLHFTLGVAF